MVAQGRWAILIIPNTSLIHVPSLHTQPALSRREEGQRGSRVSLFLFSRQPCWPQKSYQLLAPINQSLVQPGWFLSVFTDNFPSVSLLRDTTARAWTDRLPRLGRWGRADTLALSNSSTFSLKAYEALIENPGSNGHYLGYMINISWAELRFNT